MGLICKSFEHVKTLEITERLKNYDKLSQMRLQECVKVSTIVVDDSFIYAGSDLGIIQVWEKLVQNYIFCFFLIPGIQLSNHIVEYSRERKTLSSAKYGRSQRIFDLQFQINNQFFQTI